MLGGCSSRNSGWAIILIFGSSVVANVVGQGRDLSVSRGGSSDRSLIVLRSVSQGIIIVKWGVVLVSGRVSIHLFTFCCEARGGELTDWLA